MITAVLLFGLAASFGNQDEKAAEEAIDDILESLQGSNVEIIDLMTDDANPGNARENAYQTLKKFPDIAGMVGLWSYNGPSIVQALRPEGKLGKIKIKMPAISATIGERCSAVRVITISWMVE